MTPPVTAITNFASLCLAGKPHCSVRESPPRADPEQQGNSRLLLYYCHVSLCAQPLVVTAHTICSEYARITDFSHSVLQ